jgi:hypothetical protein
MTEQLAAPGTPKLNYFVKTPLMDSEARSFVLYRLERVLDRAGLLRPDASGHTALVKADDLRRHCGGTLFCDDEHWRGLLEDMLARQLIDVDRRPTPQSRITETIHWVRPMDFPAQ